MRDLKIALIGCGRIGFLLENDSLRQKPCTHYGGARAAGLRINYACDINTERLYKFAKSANIKEENCFIDYRELILSVKPDLVIIGTWTDSHADIGIFASNNDARTIVCEKPIASNLIQAKRLIEECAKHNVALIINHERRYETRYRNVKRLLSEGKIGDIKTVNASILTSPYRGNSNIGEGGGPLLHDGTHMIDIIRYFFGEIKSALGEIDRDNRDCGFEDRATAWLKTERGIDIFLEAGGSRDYFVFELNISGTKGKIVIGNGYERIYINRKSRLYSGFRDLSEKPFSKTKGINYFKREYLEVKKTLNRNNIEITSSGLDGYKAMEAIHAIYLSSYLNSKRMELPIRPETNIKKIFNLPDHPDM
ncbi:MAG: Gfo/Idh/MocA family oxidoreductase [Spirochaetota bacterium]|nr:Gfo/Idh/MocA family oxidoreductase [Spirochaetota bacterium]